VRKSDGAWLQALVDILERGKLAQPDELGREINAAMSPLGVDITLYLADLEQVRLWPVPEPGKSAPEPISIDGTVAGRSYMLVTTMPAGERSGPLRLWVPIVDDSERLGVADVLMYDPPTDLAAFQLCRERIETVVALVAHLVTTKLPYGDLLHQVRRTTTMGIAGELLRSMLPPLTFACHRMVVGAIFEPCYEVGGDAFDYAVDGAVARFVVLDAMGHGLSAGLGAAVALAAIRAARRDGHGLFAMAQAADTELTEQFPELRFVTGVLAELGLDNGLLRYINAGHPAPLLMRRGKAVLVLDGGRRLPMGIGDGSVTVAEASLEPGDRLLLYTDGVVQARGADDEEFGVDRLADLAERSTAADLPAPETLRRLSQAVIEHQYGPPADDATILLMEWSRTGPQQVHP
jgi:hypothetical protein